jgi:hypothetical protein
MVYDNDTSSYMPDENELHSDNSSRFVWPVRSASLEMAELSDLGGD